MAGSSGAGSSGAGYSGGRLIGGSRARRRARKLDPLTNPGIGCADAKPDTLDRHPGRLQAYAGMVGPRKRDETDRLPGGADLHAGRGRDAASTSGADNERVRRYPLAHDAFEAGSRARGTGVHRIPLARR